MFVQHVFLEHCVGDESLAADSAGMRHQLNHSMRLGLVFTDTVVLKAQRSHVRDIIVVTTCI